MSIEQNSPEQPQRRGQKKKDYAPPRLTVYGTVERVYGRARRLARRKVNPTDALMLGDIGDAPPPSGIP